MDLDPDWIGIQSIRIHITDIFKESEFLSSIWISIFKKRIRNTGHFHYREKLRLSVTALLMILLILGSNILFFFFFIKFTPNIFFHAYSAYFICD